MSVPYLLEIWDTQPKPEMTDAVRRAIKDAVRSENVLCDYMSENALCFFVAVGLSAEEPDEHADYIKQAAWQANGEPFQISFRYYALDDAPEFHFGIDEEVLAEDGAYDIDG